PARGDGGPAGGPGGAQHHLGGGARRRRRRRGNLTGRRITPFGVNLRPATMGCMATHLQRESETAPAWRLTDGLDAKLAGLRDRGFEVTWIESCRADLTRLIVEGGEAAIRLDPDPGVDRAWYGDVEIRHNSAHDET